jgi:tetratricopeptide (TPR) repeat protein
MRVNESFKLGLRTGDIIVLLCLTLFVVFVSTTKISDYDFWWHLKNGEIIYNTGNILSTDSYSYTFFGEKQFNGEWLADLLLYLSYKSGGFLGVNILKVSMVMLTFLFLFFSLRSMSSDERTGFYTSVIILILVLLSIRARLFNVRPFFFSYLFLSIFLFVITHYDKNKDKRILYLLPLIEVLWANMSKGAFFGPLLLSLFVIGEYVNRRPDFSLVITLAAVVLSSMLSPETYRIYLLPFGIAAADKNITVDEHQPLSFQALWGYYGFKYTFAYQLIVLGSLIYFIFFKGWKNLYHLMLFIAFFIPSIMMIRMIDFFSLTAGILLVKPLDWVSRIAIRPDGKGRFAISIAVSILISGITFVTVSSSRSYLGFAPKEDTFPEEALAFLDKEGIDGRLFNSYAFGGYIIWRSPDRKVFIDGRGHHYLYSNDFSRDYRRIIKNANDWKSAERLWGFDYAVLEYERMRGYFPEHLNKNPDWALVYWDNHSAVYLKRTEKNIEAIKSYEYKIAKPMFYDFSYIDKYVHTGGSTAVLEQLDREISMNTSNHEPRLAKAYLLYRMGASYYDDALKELEITLKLKPKLSMKHSAIAIIMFEKGQIDRAKDEVKKAMAIDPDDPGANYLKKILGI